MYEQTWMNLVWITLIALGLIVAALVIIQFVSKNPEDEE